MNTKQKHMVDLTGTQIGLIVVGVFTFVVFIIYVCTIVDLYSRTNTLNNNQRIILQTAYTATLDEDLPRDNTFSTRHLVQFDSNARQLFITLHANPESGTSITVQINRIFTAGSSSGPTGGSESLLLGAVQLDENTATNQLLNYSNSLAPNVVNAGDVIEIIATSTSVTGAQGLLVTLQVWAPQQEMNE